MIRVKDKPEVRTCKICGKEFYPRTKNSTICDEPHYFTCKVCGKQFEANRKYLVRGRIPKVCSPECRGGLKSQTAYERNMSEEAMDRAMEDWNKVQALRANGGKYAVRLAEAETTSRFPEDIQEERREKMASARSLLLSFAIRKKMETAYAFADMCLRHKLLDPLPPDVWMAIRPNPGACPSSRTIWVHMACGNRVHTRTAFCSKCGHPMSVPSKKST